MPAVLLLLLAAVSLPPKPDHYVTDRAGVLRNANALNEKLANFERQTSDQILVYVDQHLPPNTTIEEMGSEAMRQWGVGRKGQDNGAILFVFVADRKMRIEVGYGLEGSLTDANSKRITSTVIKPEFQRGDYEAGITKGVDAILATIHGEPYGGSGRTVRETARRIVIPLWVWPPVVVFCIGLFFLVFRRRRGVMGRTFTSGSSSSSWSRDSSSSSWSNSSSSSSSSSFEGGGGSGGGGGASDSW